MFTDHKCVYGWMLLDFIHSKKKSLINWYPIITQYLVFSAQTYFGRKLEPSSASYNIRDEAYYINYIRIL